MHSSTLQAPPRRPKRTQPVKKALVDAFPAQVSPSNAGAFLRAVEGNLKGEKKAGSSYATDLYQTLSPLRGDLCALASAANIALEGLYREGYGANVPVDVDEAALASVTNSAVLRSMAQETIRAKTDPQVLLRADAFEKLQTHEQRLAFWDEPNLRVEVSKYFAASVQAMNIANLRAMDNLLRCQNSLVQALLTTDEKIREVPVTIESAEAAVKYASENGVSYGDLIEGLHRMRPLQLVGTEHPTDESSKAADQAKIDFRRAPDAATLAKAAEDLIQARSLDVQRRTTDEEAERNQSKMAHRVYRAHAAFAAKIHGAVRAFYKDYRADDVDDALVGKVQTEAWAGVESDGNANVTAAVTERSLLQIPRNSARAHEASVQALLRAVVRPLAEARVPFDGEFAGEGAARVAFEALGGALESFLAELASYHRGLNDGDRESRKIDGRRPEAVFEQMWAGILRDHGAAIAADTGLSKAISDFSRDLRNFGFHIERGEGRNKAPLHVQVWDSIFVDLVESGQLADNPLVAQMRACPLKRLAGVADAEPVTRFFEALLSGSEDAKAVLCAVRKRFDSGGYGPENARSDNAALSDKALFAVREELTRHRAFARHDDVCDVLINSNSAKPYDPFAREALMVAGRVLACEDPAALRTVDFRADLANRNVALLESKPDLNNAIGIYDRHTRFRVEVLLTHAYAWEQAHPPADGTRPALATLLELSEDPSEAVRSIHAFAQLEPIAFAARLEKTPLLKAYLSYVYVEAMVGYSDAERESGVGALPTVARARENLMRYFSQLGLDGAYAYTAATQVRELFAEAGLDHRFFSEVGALFEDFRLDRETMTRYGVSGTLFDGNGGDLCRGGKGRVSGQAAPPKGTIQGEHRNQLETNEAMVRQQEKQFFTELLSTLEPERRYMLRDLGAADLERLRTVEVASTDGYEAYYREDQFAPMMSAFMGLLGNWFVKALNSSSRATSRSATDSQDDSRWKGLRSTDADRPESVVVIGLLRAISKRMSDEFPARRNNLWGGVGAPLAEVEVPNAVERNLEGASLPQLQAQLEGVVAPIAGVEMLGDVRNAAGRLQTLSLDEQVRLYNQSDLFQRIVERGAAGVALTDFALMRQMVFGDADPRFQRTPDARMRRARAQFARSPQFFEQWTRHEIASQLASGKISHEAYGLLFDFVCMMEDEVEGTRNKLHALLRRVYPDRVPALPHEVERRRAALNDALPSSGGPRTHRFLPEDEAYVPTDLLRAWPTWHAQCVARQPLQNAGRAAFAHVVRSVNHQSRVDEVYGPRFAEFLGNVGTAINEADKTEPGQLESIYNPYVKSPGGDAEPPEAGRDNAAQFADAVAVLGAKWKPRKL